MSDNQSTYVPVDWLAKARAAEADENTFEARKAYQRVAEQNPGNAEAAFFLAAYDAEQSQNSEIAERCDGVAEKLGAAADALRGEGDAAARFAPMARRVSGLADRCIRGADFVREHFRSTDRRDLDIADRRRNSWCASAIRLLGRAEACAAGIPGAEGDLLRLRRESLDALNTHGSGIPEKERIAEVRRLAAEIRKADPDADTGVPAATRFARFKVPAMGILFLISAALLTARLTACQTKLVAYPISMGQAIFTAAVVLCFDGLFLWAVRSRDSRAAGYGAKMSAGIFLGAQAALLILSVMSARSMPSPLNRGFAMPVDTLVVGTLLLYYVFRSPLRANWGTLLMTAVAVGFLVFTLVSQPDYDAVFDNYAKERDFYGGIQLSAQQEEAAKRETVDPEDEASYLTREQVGEIAEWLKVTVREDQKIQTRDFVLNYKMLERLVDEREGQIAVSRRGFLLNTIGIFFFDLACAVGLLNLEPAGKKKQTGAKKTR
ncbi:MAG: hypothetical protein IKS31_09685 [Clostridia bacterium]|nr:hypothetical protein [Clostridia bacterium]